MRSMKLSVMIDGINYTFTKSHNEWYLNHTVRTFYFDSAVKTLAIFFFKCLVLCHKCVKLEFVNE